RCRAVTARAVWLVGDQTNQLVALLGRVAHEFQVATHDRDGGAQFVPGVVDEPTLLDEGTLQPVQHAVELLGEGCDVVTAAGDVDAPGQVLLGDVRCGLSDQTHGTHDAYGYPPCGGD